MVVLSLLLGGSGVFPRIYDNFVRFGWVCSCVGLYIYSIEEPGCLGDTGSVGRGLADPLPLHLSFSLPLLFYVRAWRGWGGVYVAGMLHAPVLVVALLLET